VATIDSGCGPLAAVGGSGVSVLTVSDVVERYGGLWSPWTVRDLARRGLMPHRVAPGTRPLQFPEAWLDAWDAGAELETVKVRGPRGVSPGRIVRPKPVRP
jgi:hypothetical protein